MQQPACTTPFFSAIAAPHSPPPQTHTVGRSADTIAAIIAAGADVLFANRREALALTASAPLRALLTRDHPRPPAAAHPPAVRGSEGCDGGDGGEGGEGDGGGVALPVARNAAEAAEQLSRLAPMVVVTDGSRCALSQAAQHQPPALDGMLQLRCCNCFFNQ